MDRYSILDQNSTPPPGPVQNAIPQRAEEQAGVRIVDEEDIPGGVFQHGSVSAAIAAVNALAGPTPAPPPLLRHGLRFPGDDGGRSLAEMAQRDLDAALQLLADRAQYITGASGAAIALRRDGRKDMLCRASAGSNAPELGALLSTESGLSGESVRTRLPLRCDDTERDPRVNREGCRELGIASVLILPILGDGEALGVFELFSGQVNAFSERDLSALQRLGEMVETALKLTHAAENLMPEILAPGMESATPGEAGIQADQIADAASSPIEARIQERIFAGRSSDAVEIDEPLLMEVETEVVPPDANVIAEVASLPTMPSATLSPSSPQEIAAAPAAARTEGPKKPLMWSAALTTGSAAPKPAAVDQSHIPPMLRNLRQCKACGFPVSESRTLCVECEEKKFRGQLRMPATPLPEHPSVPVARSGSAVDYSGATQFAAARQAPAAEAAKAQPSASFVEKAPLQASAVTPLSASVPVPTNAPIIAPVNGSAKLADALAAKKFEPRSEASAAPASPPPTPVPPVLAAQQPPASLLEAMQSQAASSPAATTTVRPTAPAPSAALRPETVTSAADSPIFSAGIGSSQSFFSANKYIFGALLLVAGVVAAILYLR